MASAQSASSALTDLENDAIRYKDNLSSGRGSSAGDVAAARRAASSAAAARQSAADRVDDAQDRLDAASRLVADAAAAYESDAQTAITRLGRAYEQALAENSVWEKIRSSDAWQVLVTVANVVAVAAGFIAILVGGPFALLALLASVVLLADALLGFATGDGSWIELISAAVAFIPGGALLKVGKGITKLGLKIAPKLTTAITGALAKLASKATTSITTVRNMFTAGSHETALAAETGDALSSLARSKVQMYGGHITAHPDSPALQRMYDGSRFNWERSGNFQYNEVHVTRPGRTTYARVDSYTPGQAIVSRKASQLAEISPKTAKSYIRKAAEMYGPDAKDITIAGTPANMTQFGDCAGDLVGERLTGQLILEVPIQNSPIPQEILEYAEKLKVEIHAVPRVR